jgi:hypothetical protein
MPTRQLEVPGEEERLAVTGVGRGRSQAERSEGERDLEVALVEKGQAVSCRAISWLGGSSRKVGKVGTAASRCRTNQRLEGSAAARRGRCQGGDERDGPREGETRGTLHRLSGDRGRAARRVVAGASIEAGVTKCVRVCWGKQRSVQRTKERASEFLSSCKAARAAPNRIGRAKPQRGSAPRRRLPKK